MTEGKSVIKDGTRNKREAGPHRQRIENTYNYASYIQECIEKHEKKRN